MLNSLLLLQSFHRIHSSYQLLVIVQLMLRYHLKLVVQLLELHLVDQLLLFLLLLQQQEPLQLLELLLPLQLLLLPQQQELLVLLQLLLFLLQQVLLQLDLGHLQLKLFYQRRLDSLISCSILVGHLL